MSIIIVDQLSKSIIELSDRKFIAINGDFDSILDIINKKYKWLHLPNMYVNYIPCFDKIAFNIPMIVLSTLHQKIFIVNQDLFKKNKPNDILWRLIWFNGDIINKINRKYDISLYGNSWFFSKFQNISINNKNDLIAHSIYIDTYKEWNLWKSNSLISLQYLHSNNNIALSESAWSWVSKIKEASVQKSLSEVLERFSAWIVPSVSISEDIAIAKNIIELYIWKFALQEAYDLYDIIDLYTKNNYRIPWDLLFYPYPYKQYINTSSNGMACHISYTLAIENALFELIERDTFVLSWLLKSGIYIINKNAKISARIKKYNLAEFDVQLFILKLDNPIPVVLCIVRKNSKISTSLGAHYSLDMAIKKSLMESWQFNIENILSNWSNNNKDDMIYMHLEYYLDDNNFNKIEWYFGLPWIDYKHARWLFPLYTSAKKIITHYYKLWINIYCYKYKNPILKVFKRYCVRVISDNLLYIWFGKKVPDPILKSKRLKYRKKYFNVKSLNLEIHPFG